MGEILSIARIPPGRTAAPEMGLPDGSNVKTGETVFQRHPQAEKRGSGKAPKPLNDG